MTEGAAPLLERLPGERMLAAMEAASRAGAPPLAVKVAVILAYHDAGSGAWPSIPAIVERLSPGPATGLPRVQRRNVQRALKALEALGLIETEARAGKASIRRLALPPGGGRTAAPHALPAAARPPPENNKGAAVRPPLPAAARPPPPRPHGRPHYVEPELNRKEEPEYQSRRAEPRISDGRGKAATRAAARGQTDRLPARPDGWTDDIAAAVQAWNDLAGRCGLPRVQRLTETRRRALRSRLREAGGIDGWRAALAAIEASPFLTGDNDRGWRADFDFVLKPQRFTKIVEGGYPAGRRGESSNTRNARIALERIHARERENPDGDPHGF